MKKAAAFATAPGRASVSSPATTDKYRLVVCRPVRFSTPQGERAIGAIVQTDAGRHFEWRVSRANLFDPRKLRGHTVRLARLGFGMLVHEAFLRAVRSHGAERIVLRLGPDSLQTTVATWLGEGEPADLGAGAGLQLHLRLAAFEGGEELLRRLSSVAPVAASMFDVPARGA